MTEEERLKNKKLWLLDMDGTIYLGEKVFDGTKDFLKTVRENGGDYMFLTNNSSKGTIAYAEKLNRMGIEADPGDFFTSADAAVSYIKGSPLKDICFFVCGTESLKEMLKRNGIKVAVSHEDGEGVLLGYDTELTFAKLESCCILLMKGVPYLATHPDLVCPTLYGAAPDCGSIINILEEATKRRPEHIIGKPQPDMVYAAMKAKGVKKEETCLMGDRLYTDIACGVNAGIDTVFVLSGEGVPEDIEKYNIRPTFVFDGIRTVCKKIKKIK